MISDTVLPPPLNNSEMVLRTVRGWINELWAHVYSVEFIWQIAAVIASILVGIIIARIMLQKMNAQIDTQEQEGVLLGRLRYFIGKTGWAIATVVILWSIYAIFGALDRPRTLLRVVASLMNAWIVVHLVASNMKPGFWSQLFVFVAWTAAALHILRWLEPVLSFLDSLAINFSGFNLSLLQVITSAIAVVLALWLGRLAGDAAQSQLRSTPALTPSMAGLLGQVAKIGFMVIAVVVALYSVGINLTALTVFSGALGVGIGFGLQAIFSNFISGIIILLEKSVTVGDFIELQSGVTGLVTEINIRSTLITTNDNVDILVPNEEFIKAQVINWTLREARRRLRIKFGVAYGTKKELVRDAGLEAAEMVEWTYKAKGREPQVWLVGFGDSSLDFELVVWLREAAVSRPARVEADYNWALLEVLEKYDIEIPFPQRDLNIRQPAKISVTIDDGELGDKIKKTQS